MKLFFATLLCLTLRGTMGQVSNCGATNADIRQAVINTFVGGACVSGIDESSTSLSCTFDREWFNGQASYEAAVNSDGSIRPVSLTLSGSTTMAARYTFPETCLSEIQELLDIIKGEKECPGSSSDISSAVMEAFQGPGAGCNILSDTLRCTLSIEDFAAVAEYAYAIDSNDYIPRSLSISITSKDSGAFTEFIDFDQTCLFHAQPALYRIAMASNRRCSDSAVAVYNEVMNAYKEENCQRIVYDGWPDYEEYECSVEVPDEFTSTAKYRMVNYPGQSFPDSLDLYLEYFRGPANGEVYDFTRNCLVGSESDILDVVRGSVGNAGCNDSFDEVRNDLMMTYGQGNCRGDSQNQYCETVVAGFVSTAELTSENGQPSLSLALTYADDYATPSNATSFEFDYDFDSFGSCRSDLQRLLQDVQSMRQERDCSNSAEEIAYRRNNKDKTTTCAKVAQMGPRKKFRLCNRVTEISEACKGICRTGEYCICEENPGEFPLNQIKSQTCARLAKKPVNKMNKKCGRNRWASNCPRTCGCKFQEPELIL